MGSEAGLDAYIENIPILRKGRNNKRMRDHISEADAVQKASVKCKRAERL